MAVTRVGSDLEAAMVSEGPAVMSNDDIQASLEGADMNGGSQRIQLAADGSVVGSSFNGNVSVQQHETRSNIYDSEINVLQRDV